MTPALPFLQWVPWGRFPTFTGHIERSDSLSLIPRHFVAFVQRYHPVLLVRSHVHGAQSTRARAWSPDSLHRLFISVETTGSPKFPGDPHVHMPCSPTPVGPPRLAWTVGSVVLLALRYCLLLAGRHRLPQQQILRGSITRPAHSLSTLGSEGLPSPTQDSLPAAGQALPDRRSSAGSRCKVSSYVISVLLARASWRTPPEDLFLVARSPQLNADESRRKVSAVNYP